MSLHFAGKNVPKCAQNCAKFVKNVLMNNKKNCRKNIKNKKNQHSKCSGFIS
jgi:hypothetical protein